MRVTESRNHIANSEIPIKAQTCYLEHVRIAVVGVLHHHHLDSGQRVRDAVLVFVAYGLKGNRVEKMGEARREEENLKSCVESSITCASHKISTRISAKTLMCLEKHRLHPQPPVCQSEAAKGGFSMHVCADTWKCARFSL